MAGTDTVIRHNEGYKTEKGGVMSVVNGSYVSRGLVATSTTIQLTPTGQRITRAIRARIIKPKTPMEQPTSSTFSFSQPRINILKKQASPKVGGSA